MTKQKQAEQSDKGVYTVAETAQFLGINLIKTYDLCRAKGFPAVRIGKRIVVPKKALDRWLDEQAGM